MTTPEKKIFTLLHYYALMPLLFIYRIKNRAKRMGKRRRGRPRMGWVEGIENILKEGVRSTKYRRACMRACMRVEEVKDVCRDRVKWRSILSAYPARDMA
jgi:hypothetical protein